MFGWYNCNSNLFVYVDFIIAVEEISSSLEFNSWTWLGVGSLLEKLIKFESVFTGKMYLILFGFTSPLSKYLQTNGMNILKTNGELKTILRDYQSTYELTNELIK